MPNNEQGMLSEHEVPRLYSLLDIQQIHEDSIKAAIEETKEPQVTSTTITEVYARLTSTPVENLVETNLVTIVRELDSLYKKDNPDKLDSIKRSVIEEYGETLSEQQLVFTYIAKFLKEVIYMADKNLDLTEGIVTGEQKSIDSSNPYSDNNGGSVGGAVIPQGGATTVVAAKKKSTTALNNEKIKNKKEASNVAKILEGENIENLKHIIEQKSQSGNLVQIVFNADKRQDVTDPGNAGAPLKISVDSETFEKFKKKYTRDMAVNPEEYDAFMAKLTNSSVNQEPDIEVKVPDLETCRIVGINVAKDGGPDVFIPIQDIASTVAVQYLGKLTASQDASCGIQANSIKLVLDKKTGTEQSMLNYQFINKKKFVNDTAGSYDFAAVYTEDKSEEAQEGRTIRISTADSIKINTKTKDKDGKEIIIQPAKKVAQSLPHLRGDRSISTRHISELRDQYIPDLETTYVYTDDLGIYDPETLFKHHKSVKHNVQKENVDETGQNEEKIRHDEKFVKDGIHTNTVESLFSTLSYYWPTHRAITRKHVQKYLDMLNFRENNKNLTTEEKIHKYLSNLPCVPHQKIKELIGDEPTGRISKEVRFFTKRHKTLVPNLENAPIEDVKCRNDFFEKARPLLAEMCDPMSIEPEKRRPFSEVACEFISLYGQNLISIKDTEFFDNFIQECYEIPWERGYRGLDKNFALRSDVGKIVYDNKN